MKSDRFTKTMLALIAIFLGIRALKPAFQVKTALAGSGNFSNVKYIGGFHGGPFGGKGFASFLLDETNGKVWLYAFEKHGTRVKYKGRIVEMGKPLVETKN